MRSDYGLYVVALICFIIAGALLASAGQDMSYIATAIFAILGVLFAAWGYALRPKVSAATPTAPPQIPAEPSPPPSLPTAEEKVEEVPVAPLPPSEEVPPPTPTIEEAPAPALEESARVQEEKPAEKPARRRRKKKAT